MALPGHNTIALWVIEGATNSNFHPLQEIAYEIVAARIPTASPESVADHIEWLLPKIIGEIDQRTEDYIKQGIEPRYQLLQDDSGSFLKVFDSPESDIVLKMKALTADEFEEFCALILTKLGGKGLKTGKTGDGGVDFMCEGLRLGTDPGPAPPSSCTLVFGQAKKYTNSYVKLSEVRAFIGGALLKAHEWKASPNASGPLTPVLFAFWTTSDFQTEARKYADSVGISALNGIALAQLALRAGITME